MDAAEEGGASRFGIEAQERKFEQFPACGRAEKIVRVQIAMNPSCMVQGLDYIERLVDEGEPVFGIKRRLPDQLIERFSFEKLKDMISAVLGIKSVVEELYPAFMESGHRAGEKASARLKAQAQGDLIIRSHIAGAKDTGFASRANRVKQKVTRADERVFHGKNS